MHIRSLKSNVFFFKSLLVNAAYVTQNLTLKLHLVSAVYARFDSCQKYSSYFPLQISSMGLCNGKITCSVLGTK